ncbi:putative secreted protein [Wickerhamomyces ciferrii]|uniref:Secreted protein n=1 Tax=Wickerhamomyces ciferrii (strain ATCC 14091 / BCRC 22168 / CBS 111 / JCM 3599 / NBRC 0793 / NRRL Y-1031 F-60-10) TaxID=1206466 RepID=K0KQT9_WICCF|nr:uncharacterized protein BN7_3191 [Wickerhamomyces ciferrii]CCH43638.1 putative secreted protein [Wickerhamomyces ciferrii]
MPVLTASSSAAILGSLVAVPSAVYMKAINDSNSNKQYDMLIQRQCNKISEELKLSKELDQQIQQESLRIKDLTEKLYNV